MRTFFLLFGAIAICWATRSHGGEVILNGNLVYANDAVLVTALDNAAP